MSKTNDWTPTTCSPSKDLRSSERTFYYTFNFFTVFCAKRIYGRNKEAATGERHSPEIFFIMPNRRTLYNVDNSKYYTGLKLIILARLREFATVTSLWKGTVRLELIRARSRAGGYQECQRSEGKTLRYNVSLRQSSSIKYVRRHLVSNMLRCAASVHFWRGTFRGTVHVPNLHASNSMTSSLYQYSLSTTWTAYDCLVSLNPCHRMKSIGVHWM